MEIETFNQEFENIAPSLKSYLLRISASIADTEDLLQDTYVKALDKLYSFREEASLKTWIFTISTNLARDNKRTQKRWSEKVTDIARDAALNDHAFFQEAMAIQMHDPKGKFEAREHVAFCFTCISKSLPLEEQLCIFLKEVYGFKTAEIAIILEISGSMVKYYLHKGRNKMIGIFDNRCSLINKNGVCHQCSELTGIYNPQQNIQTALMEIEMVREANDADKEHLFDLRMKILKELDPFESGAATLQLHHLEHNRRVMENYSEKNG